MFIYNSCTKTFPVIFHSPGVRGQDRDLFKRIVKLSKPFTEIEDLTLVTWNSLDKISLLEQHQKCVVLGKGIENWHNVYKTELICEYLKNVKTKYVMGLDAFDAIPLDMNKAMERFIAMDCKMLISTARTYFPCGGDVVTSKLKSFQKNLTDSKYCYLNSGAWIGEKDILIDFFHACKSNIKEIERLVVDGVLPKVSPPYKIDCANFRVTPKKSPATDDQITLSMTLPNYYPEVRLDHWCNIFQTINECNDLSIEVRML